MAGVLVIDVIVDMYWSMGTRQEHVVHVETGLAKRQLVQLLDYAPLLLVKTVVHVQTFRMAMFVPVPKGLKVQLVQRKSVALPVIGVTVLVDGETGMNGYHVQNRAMDTLIGLDRCGSTITRMVVLSNLKHVQVQIMHIN